MKKCLLYLLICVMGITAQAVIIDDFEDGNLDEYTSTVILDAGGTGSNTANWQIEDGELQLNTTVYDGIEQYAMIYAGLSLPVGAELQVDINRTTDSQDIGLYVGGTTPVTGTRQDYVAVYARNDGFVYSRGFDGTSEYGLWGSAAAVEGLESLFVERTGENTYVTGYYANGVRTIAATRTPAFANDADVVGFYADVRAVGLNGNADNLRIISNPYDPSVDQADGTTGVDVTLNWSAGVDPLGVEAVDPDIVDQYVFMSDDLTSDPNLYYVGATGDPGTTDPASSLTVLDLPFDTSYNWAVVEALDGYAQTLDSDNTLDDIDPNNTTGPIWSFATVSEQPTVSAVSPAYSVVDADDDPTVVLTVTGLNVDDYQWYREGDLGPLTEGAKYAGVDTDTLTITDVEQADEGYYYCYVENTAGDATSASGRLLTQRLMSYYTFETTSVVDGNTITPDIVGNWDMVLTGDDPDNANNIASVGDANEIIGYDATGYGNQLVLDNGYSLVEDDDPNNQYAEIYPGVAEYEDITITVWVHPKDYAVWGRVFDFGDDTTTYMFMSADNGQGYDPEFAITIGSGEQELVPDLNSENWIGPGAWHHMAVTISGGTGRMYVDGVLLAANSDMTITPLDISATHNYIGKSQWDDPEFPGLIDELKIYNYALTTEEIAQDYLAIAGGSVCNLETYDMGDYDADGDCKITLTDFAAFAARWLEDDRIYLP